MYDDGKIKRLLIQVSGYGVAAFEVDDEGYCGKPVYVRDISDAVFRLHDYVIIVEDREFNTGLHYTTALGSEHGYAGYRLHLLMSRGVYVELHEAHAANLVTNEPAILKAFKWAKEKQDVAS